MKPYTFKTNAAIEIALSQSEYNAIKKFAQGKTLTPSQEQYLDNVRNKVYQTAAFVKYGLEEKLFGIIEDRIKKGEL